MRRPRSPAVVCSRACATAGPPSPTMAGWSWRSRSACSSPATSSGCRWPWRCSATTWVAFWCSAIPRGSVCSRPARRAAHMIINPPMRPPPTPEPRIRLGISACLLGDEVRYDGGHKRDPFLTTVLGPFVEWVKVCPEVEVGMGTPRESIRLVDQHGAIRMLTVKTGIDHTASMTAYSARKAKELAAEDLSGYVLKKDSPSCGMTL